MREEELKAIVETVTAQVLAAMRGQAAVTVCADSRRKLLVVGAAAEVPPRLCEHAVLCDLEAYAKDGTILRYDGVIISQLSCLQLVDIAQGRPTDAAAQAVLSALLEGREVTLLESALPHRGYAGRGSTRLYGRYEECVRTILGFGAKLWTPERAYRAQPLPAKPAKYQPPAQCAPKGGAKIEPERIITEAVAITLAGGANGVVHVPYGAIITPSAEDVFKRAQLAVAKDL